MIKPSQLCFELYELVTKSEHGADTAKLEIVESILRKITGSEWADEHVRNSANWVSECFGKWFSIAGWNDPDDDEEIRREKTISAIEALRKVSSDTAGLSMDEIRSGSLH